MRTIPALMIAASILFTSLPIYALTVNVSSTSKNLDGLGFTTKGKQYGGIGTHYQKSGMSKGSYTFGVRTHGKDVGCKDQSGKRQINITNDANVELSLINGRSCTLSLSSK